MLDEEVKNGLSEHFGDQLEQVPHEQLLTLALAYSEEEITNERLQYALNMHRADITKMLSKMCSQQLLVSLGRGRGTRYHVYGMDVNLMEKVATSDQKVATSDQKVATSDQKVATSDQKVATSDQKVATSDQKVATSKKHFSREMLRKIIVEYCAEWRTLDDISAFIGRDRNYLRNKILPQMTDVIEKMYENIPNHPRQKYRAKQKDGDA